MQLKENEKILVCDFRRIGDGIMSLPIFEALKKRYPSCYTIFVCENIAKGIGDNNPFIDEVLYFNPKNIWQTIRLIFNVRSKKIDLAIDSLGMPKTAILAYLSGANLRIGIHKKRRFFYTHLYEGEFLHSYSAHHKLSVLKLIDAFPSEPLPLPFINIDEQTLKKTKLLLDGLNLEPKNYLTSSPTTKVDLSRWGAKNWASLYDKIIEKSGLKIALIYAPNERFLVDEILDLVKNKNHIIDNLRFESLQELSSFLKHSKLHFTQDNGTKHLANTQKTPCVSVFGQTSNPDNWAIKQEGIIDEVLCKPLKPSDPKDTKTVDLISIDEFFNKIKKYIV